MTTYPYTLKLGDFYLAPKYSIKVEESSDFETLIDNASGGGCDGASCALVTEREFKFKLYLLGGGSLASAWSLRSQIDTALCVANIDLYRRVFDETALIYRITSGRTRIVDVRTQYLCESILTLELILKLKSVPASVLPLNVYVSFPTPSLNVIHTVNVSPLAVQASIITPVVV